MCSTRKKRKAEEVKFMQDKGIVPRIEFQLKYLVEERKTKQL